MGPTGLGRSTLSHIPEDSTDGSAVIAQLCRAHVMGLARFLERLCIISFTPDESLIKKVLLLCPFHKGGDGGAERALPWTPRLAGAS